MLNNKSDFLMSFKKYKNWKHLFLLNIYVQKEKGDTHTHEMKEYTLFDILEYFGQTEYNKIGWLLLIVLDKVEKERDKPGIPILSSSTS